jgi:YVTN family beta-propeller protein
MAYIQFRITQLAAAFTIWALLGPNAAAQYVTQLQSSPVTLSANDLRLFNVNPSANTITAFDVTTDSPVLIAEAPVGRDPSSLAVHPNGSKLYVANSFDGTITVMSLPDYNTTNTITVGAEPSAVCITPNGTLLFVANSSSNNLMAIDTASETVVQTVDLSPYGTAPRAIAITNSGGGDDTVETVFVAMFYGQLQPGRSAVHEGQDNQREGRVVAVPIATYQSQVAVLGPVADTGFLANGRLAGGAGGETTVQPTNPQTFTTTTGCYPNQLAAIALNPANGYAYAVSTAASPNGPFRFNVNAQGLVSVFDTGSLLEITAGQSDPQVRRTAPLNLNQGVNLATSPSPRLFHSNPVAMAWRPDGSDAWVVIQNTDLVVRLTVDDGGIPTVGAPLVMGPSAITRIDLQAVDGGQIAGKAPRGIAINSRGDRAYVYNFISRSITIIDISSPLKSAIVGTAQSTALPAPGTREARALLGAELFFSGRVADTSSPPNQRMSQEGWGACIICHPNGRSDNVTWMFDAGPRQTIPLDGMFNKKNPADQRILNWSAVRDENHDFELNTRGVFNGRGLIEDDRLFLAIGGGLSAGSENPAIEQFQQFTGTVSTTNDLANGAALPTLDGFTPRRDFAVATLGNDRVFIIGGRFGTSSGTLVPATDAVLEFNPRTNVLRRRNSTGFTLRHSLGAAAVRTRAGFRIYAIGGYSSTDLSSLPVSTVEEYNPFTDSWRTVAALPRVVAQFAITVAGGINTAEPLQLIHVISGNTASENFPSLTNATPIQRFQPDPEPPAVGTWSTFNPSGLTLRRSFGAATVLRGVQSRVFLIGGLDASGNVLSTVEEYVAQAGTLVATPHTPLPAPRSLFGIASTLSSNQIYVVGGRDNNMVDQPTIFELTVAGPAGTPSGVWVLRGNLAAARRWVQLSSPPGVTNFLPFRNAVRDSRQDAIAVWIARNVRSARAPVDPNDKAALRGRVLFGEVGLTVPNMSCATCHGGPKWTRSIVDYGAPPSPDVGLGFGNQRVIGAELRQTATQGPNSGQLPGVLIDVGTFTIAGRQNETRVNPADISNVVAPLGANGFNIPSLLSVHETAPYFYSGLAQTLDEVLDGSKDGNGGLQVHFVKDPKNRPDLITFLRSIDSTTPTFP